MDKLQKVVGLCKRRGFVFPSSEIYGGLASAYDYGPMGAELVRNIKNLWWSEFITKRADMIGLDSQIILHPKTWEASGHVSSFTDPVVEDKVTHKRYRADHLIEDWKKDKDEFAKTSIEELTSGGIAEFIREHNIKSPLGNDITDPMNFNLLMETRLGVVESEKDVAYLRGETAQGIFSNFKNVLDSTRVTLPFGIGQIGKSFRNEITLGQFIFRTFEFEQAEIEYFFDPEQSNWKDFMKSWKESMWKFVTDTLGVREENLRWRRHTDEERSHYSKETFDLDYDFFGFKELWGVAYRTDYDLNQHIKYSGADLSYTDPHSGKKFVPHVIEPAVGIDRLALMVLMDAYVEENDRVVLKLDPKVAPYSVAVFPLVKNKPEIVAKAREIYKMLVGAGFSVTWDDRGNIGKRYYSQDEIGTPKCVTIDYETLENDTVTVRDRDSMEQERVGVEELGPKVRDHS